MTSIKASALLKDSKIKNYSYGFSTTATFTEGIPHGFTILSPDFQGNAKQFLNHLWNDTEKLSMHTGKHQHVITNGHILSVEGNRIPMDKITMTYWVEVECYKGLVGIQNTVGIYDVMNNIYHCKSLETEAIEPYKVEKQWERISEEEASQIQTTLDMIVKSVY